MNILSNWKSTVNGILAFLITTGTILLASGNSLISPKVTIYITLGLALARGYVGMLEKDADKVTSTDVAKATALAVKP